MNSYSAIRKPQPSSSLVRISFLAFVFGLTGLVSPAWAWPDRPVKIVTLAGPGGGSDAVARIVAEGLTNSWGKAVIVENRPGADGIIAVNALLSAQDGHTLLFASTGVVTANPLLHPDLSYDAEKDLLPISLVVEDFIAVATSPNLAQSLPDLIKLSHGRKELLNYATVPGPPYLFSLALQRAADLKMTLVPYRNPLAAIPDLTASRVDVALIPLASVLGLGKSRLLNILAVTNFKRAPSAPDVPTVGEAGFGDLGFFGGLGFFGPKDMPTDLRNKIADDIRLIIQQPGIKQHIEEIGYVARDEGPAAFQAILRDQAAKWSDLLRLYNIKPTE